MKVLLFAGAGTSIELGVPGMVGLATEFLDHSQQWSVEPALVNRILGKELDVEHLIEELDRICQARTSLEAIKWDAVGLECVDKVRAEVEWFVQHAAERVTARDAQLMWGSVLRVTKSVEITFVTTNYDRAIELAANGEKISLDDGFQSFDQGETAPWIGFDQDKEHPVLVKLHGSTDWYADSQSGRPTKLRHPMPLFGRSALRLAGGQQLSSALVLPSREKLLTRPPYPRLSQAFLNAADCCDLAVLVGSSLRDDHISEATRSVASRAPVFIVNPKGDGQGVEAAVAIAQHASTFLVSTLPNALLTTDPECALRDAGRTAPAGIGGALPAVRQLLDTSAETGQRCHAVEELDEMGATLDPLLLCQLLADDDPTVARYALGLVPSSAASERLIEQAASSPHTGDLAFREELELLQDLVTSKDRHRGGFRKSTEGPTAA